MSFVQIDLYVYVCMNQQEFTSYKHTQGPCSGARQSQPGNSQSWAKVL